MTRSFKVPVDAPAVSVNNTAVSVEGHTHTISAAPVDANYLVTSGNATLTSERVLTQGSYITVTTDTGVNPATTTVAVDGTTTATASKVAVRDSSNIILAGNFQPNVTTLATTGTVDIDFSGAGFRTQGTLTGNIVYTASNYAAGRSITIRVTTTTGSSRTFTFPTGWRWLNSSKPTGIAASSLGVLTLTSFGTTEADVVAAWSVE